MQHFKTPSQSYTTLQELYLTSNEFQVFPDIKSRINTIVKLGIGKNKFTNITLESVYGSKTPNITAESLTHLYLFGNEIPHGEIDDRLWSTMPNLRSLLIHNMGLRVLPNLKALIKLTTLWIGENNFTTIKNIENLKYNKKLNYINLNDNKKDLTFLMDFTLLTESYTSSKLDVHLKNNKLLCNSDICWIKFLHE